MKRAQEMKEINPREVFLADDETFKRISKDSGIKKPKQQRPEIVLQQIPNSNSDEGNKLLKKESKKNLVELKWEFSLHRFLQEKQLFRAMEEEQVSSNYTFDDDDEEAEEEGLTPLFMSNIKEELAVHRIRLDYVSKNLKGNNYAKLCKEEYMSVVGPEVFDRASKLPKVISLNLKKETRSTGSVSGMADERRKSKKKLMSSDATPEQTSEKSLCSEEKSSIDVNESKNLDVNEVEAMLSALAKYASGKIIFFSLLAILFIYSNRCIFSTETLLKTQTTQRP